MLDNLLTLTNLGWLAGGVLFLVLFRLSNTVRYIPNNRVGVVEKRWSLQGSVESGFIALSGEAGFQPDVLRGGLHYLHAVPVPRAHGAARHHPAGEDRLRVRPRRRALLADADAGVERRRQQLPGRGRSSSRSGGQRGPQRKILREGTYAINLAQFVVITEDKLYYLPLDARTTRRVHADGQT